MCVNLDDIFLLKHVRDVNDLFSTGYAGVLVGVFPNYMNPHLLSLSVSQRIWFISFNPSSCFTCIPDSKRIQN